VKITYDPNKREWTLRVRRLDFDHAVDVVTGDHFERISDTQDYGEIRLVTAGYLRTDGGSCLDAA
jgi:uncharacterized DUF497 family protein